MRHKCVKCGDPATKRCSACTVSTAWYCDTKCQKSDWVAHIFDCNPKREITTADHLALAVDQNLLPEDVQTCMDYGFTRAFTVENRTQLLGLYIGLIKYLGVSPRDTSQMAKQRHIGSADRSPVQSAPGAVSRRLLSLVLTQQKHSRWFCRTYQ
ncbi:hypothetical protein AcW1_004887 [Taiwanofungus camphoratus]|nr:hypothetical protein AcW2_006103 [Antrodia cinnamomea]KAI0940066.1 hypothetical protein AcV5_001273 [Antrodia cinnamomea]KAI0941385.1 hypothetical protein AcV7_002976 [Antrodia cinnamomea]KAI0960350.1 hypothetical protein AcW1_004887 [Antrodia cinnamomea]